LIDPVEWSINACGIALGGSIIALIVPTYLRAFHSSCRKDGHARDP